MPQPERLRYIHVHPRGSARWPADREPLGTLVLIHAFPLNARMWEPQFALADHGWQVIAPHLRGFDDPTASPAADTTLDDYAGDIIDLLSCLGSGPAVVGGLSMGGYTAFALYRRAPGLFRGLVLADTRAEADSPDARTNRERMMGVARTGGATAIANEMLPKLLGGVTRATMPSVEARVRGLIQSSPPEAIVAALHAMLTRSDATPLLPSIAVPTLVIVGSDDALTPPALSATMAERIPGAELVIVPDAGHLASLEQPGLFNAALVRFLHRL
jgi:3-oxoadipate enol-lactonase